MAFLEETTCAVSLLLSTVVVYIRKAFPAETTKWLQNSLFVSGATATNMLLILFALYFWTVNRHAHFKKTKGSVVAHRAGHKRESHDDDDASVSDAEEEGEQFNEQPVSGNRRITSKFKRQGSSFRRRESLKSITALDIEFDDDEIEVKQGVQERASPYRARSDEVSISLSDANPSRPNLMGVIDKIKVFSYMGEEAQKLCLEYAENVDVQVGKYLFQRGQYDGSLYAVVSGSVTCRFHNHVLDEGSPGSTDEDPYGREDGKKLLSFSCHDGEVVSPLVAMLEGLVRERRIMSGTKQSLQPSLAKIDNISVVATSENTRLIRVPPRCFAIILEKFPAEVYRVAQTFLARLLRVTVQTLVKRLGLHEELLSTSANEMMAEREAAAKKNLSSTWVHLLTAIAMTDNVADLEKWKPVKIDAAVAAATALGVPLEHEESVLLIREHSSFVSLLPGESLIQTGFRCDAIYLLLSGRMEVGAMAPVGSSPPSYHRYYEVQPGSLLGRLRCFTGEVSMYTEKCCDGDSRAILLKIPQHVFDTLVSRHPETLSQSLENLLCLVSPVVHLIDWITSYVQLEAGETIVRRGEHCDSLYIVLNGRLRARYRLADSKLHSSSGLIRQRYEEYGRGRCIGEIGGLTGSQWPCDVFAIRNSEVARLPMSLALCIIQMYPKAGLNFARNIATQVQFNAIETSLVENSLLGLPHTMAAGARRASSLTSVKNVSKPILPSYGLTLATIAVVPLVFDVDLSEFCSTLVSSLQQIAPTKHMTKAIAREYLGEKQYAVRNAMHECKMARLLGDLEENNRMVVYQADFKYTWWTRQCVQNADCILLVVNADEAPVERRVEQCLAWVYKSMNVRIELVVLIRANSLIRVDNDSLDDEDNVVVSDQLNNWSEKRKWISGGHHRIRLPFLRHRKDFHRMCRRITGMSVGLVLGGGGARGLAHLGVIRALIEAGVTVDMVGGTSQGAYIGAIFSQYPDDFEMLMKKSRTFAKTMSSVWEKILDLTFPITSIFSGKRFNRGIKKTFGDSRIQDTILNFFCVSVDIQKRQQVIHEKGVLWRYVRASMSLAGYLPPISENGSMLVDGGYLNALPADVMRYSMGARTVIAVDVSGEKERDYFEYGTYLSGWWLLWNSLNPFVATVKVPSMTDISDCLRWVSSDQHRRNVKAAADLRLRPPIDGYGTLEFDKFDEIVDVGYRYAKPLVDEWVRRNPELVSMSKEYQE